ncbi:unnamed protein product [Closterium sp. Yama58-4]|nr:unnamed protein product [Closterium sp. Yama58-4]
MADTLLELACPGSGAEKPSSAPRNEPSRDNFDIFNNKNALRNEPGKLTVSPSPAVFRAAAPPNIADPSAAAAAAADLAGKSSPIFAPPASLAAFKASLDARTNLHASSGLLSNLPPNLSPSLLAELAGVGSAGPTAAAANTTAATAASNGGFQVPASGGGGGGMRMDEAILALQPLVRLGMQQQQQQQQQHHQQQQQQQQQLAQTQAAQAQAQAAQAQALLPALLQQYANLPSFARNFRQQDGTAAAAAGGLHGARLDNTAARSALGSSAAAALQQAVLRDIARATGAAGIGAPAGVGGAIGASAGLALSPKRGSIGRDIEKHGASAAGPADAADAAELKLSVGVPSIGGSPGGEQCRGDDFTSEDHRRRATLQDDADDDHARRRTRDDQHTAGDSSGDSNVETCPGQQRGAGAGDGSPAGNCSPGGRRGSSGGTGGAGRAGMKRSAGALGSGLDLDGLGGDAARSVRPRTVAERKRRNNISHRLEQLKAAIPLCNPRITTETLLCETLTYIDALKAKIRNLQAEKANLLEHVLTL